MTVKEGCELAAAAALCLWALMSCMRVSCALAGLAG